MKSKRRKFLVPGFINHLIPHGSIFSPFKGFSNFIKNPYMAYTKFGCILIPLLTILCLNSEAQSNSDQKKQDQFTRLKSMIDSKTFRFHAQSATSMKGRTKQLSSEYYLKINQDSLYVDLPYYGRAYSSGYPGTDLGFQFISKDFSYAADTTKKGGWDITIMPKNEAKVNSIYLSISSSGYCSVRISSSNRDPISYYGTITEYTTP
jgi:Domain of unknown function (DUF4251)